MNVVETELPGVLRIQPKVFGDPRGYFFESFHSERYRTYGINSPFVQDNVSKSRKGILRGLHVQQPFGQGKLVFVVSGAVLDVAVDVRVGSPHFGKHVAVELSEENHEQLWIPPGFAHGFLVLSEYAVFLYKCTELYHPETELSVLWSDPDIGINWAETNPFLSDKDRSAPRLRDIPSERLPQR